MKTFNTTMHLSRKEKEITEFTAKKKGFRTRNFINYCLEKNLPITKVSPFDLNINRKDYRIALYLPQSLKDRLDENICYLSDDLRKVPMYQVVLTAVLMECEG